MKILVIGSFMMDHAVTTPRVPIEGETLIGIDFDVNPGGKGANQAVAAQRLGGDVIMLGKVGDDANGHIFVNVLRNEGINVEHVLIDPEETTGVGFVTKETTGNNRIIVVPGANQAYTLNDFNKVSDVLNDVSIAVLQLEMDLEVTKAIIDILKMRSIPVILNPAPAQKLDHSVLQGLDYITPNESELNLLTGLPVSAHHEVVEAAKVLLNQGVQNVIVTLGDAGAYYLNQNESEFIEGYPANAIDTVAAGDSFNGALAVALTQGKTIREAVVFANKAGSITVTRAGAISSLPYREDLNL